MAESASKFKFLNNKFSCGHVEKWVADVSPRWMQGSMTGRFMTATGSATLENFILQFVHLYSATNSPHKIVFFLFSDLRGSRRRPWLSAPALFWRSAGIPALPALRYN